MRRKLMAMGLLVVSLIAVARAEFPPLRLAPVSQGEIVSPVGITNAADGSSRLFVTDQRGTIHILDNGSVLPTPFLDIESRLVPERPNFDERGLLGLAFHPNFGEQNLPGNDKFYVYYSAPQPNGNPDDPVNPVDHQSVIAEYAVTALGANVADPSSERVLLTFDQPQFNHDAGFLGFGSDGLLYATTGDGGGGGDNEPGHTGGGASDPSGGLGNAQDRTNLLGNVLRIDPLGSNAPSGQYGIPADNPFVGAGGGVREEIYAYGLRNAWRATFDDGPGGTGRLFAADVGQGDVEEVNLIEAGGNYGWRIKEGTFDFDGSVTPDPLVSLVDPIAQYAHPGSENGLPEVGLSVTGGVVYRGDDFPALQGKYLFGDWSNGFGQPAGTLLGLEEIGPSDFELSELEIVGGNPINEYILAFGLDENGEAYVATKQTLAPSALGPTGLPTGAIYRIEVVPEPTCIELLFLGAVLLRLGMRRRAQKPKGISRPQRLATIVAFAMTCPAATWSATILQPEDFQSGNTAGWMGASPTNLASGGPAGDADRFLQITGTGGNGPSSVPAVYHSGSDWTGDYTAAGVSAMSMDLMNAETSNPLQLRLVLFGPGALNDRWTSTASTLVPNDGVWRSYTFGVGEDDLTRVLGNSEYDGLMDNVLRVMLRHDTAGPSAGGDGTQAQLGIDNVTLVPEPQVGGVWVCLLVLLRLVAAKHR